MAWLSAEETWRSVRDNVPKAAGRIGNALFSPFFRMADKLVKREAMW